MAYLKKNFTRQFVETCPVVLLVVTPIFIRIPLEVFFSNQKDLLFSLNDFFPIFLVLSLIIVLSVSALSAILDALSHRFVLVTVFSVGILFYIQDMFMNTKLSEDDGSKLEISKMGVYPSVDSALWFVVLFVMIVLLVKYYKESKNAILYISIGVTTVQLIAAASMPINVKPIDHSVSYGLSDANEFVLANDQNTIVFILDMVGNVQMDMALSEYPNMLDEFNDFTYFNNAEGVYRPTFPSITHMLTGQYLDFSFDDAYDWLEYAWTNDRTEAYYKRFHDSNIEVDFYSKDTEYEVGSGANIYGKFDNISKYTHVVDKSYLSMQMTRMSLFRVLPYCLKSKCNVVSKDLDSAVVLEGDADPFEYYTWSFLDKLNNNGGLTKSDAVKKALKIYHLSGSHAPRLLDKNLNLTDEDVSPADAVYSSFRIVELYIDQMKQLGLYDNATIIVTADHGTMEEAIDPQPVFMIKSKGVKRDETEISNAPISHDNIMATMYESFDFDYKDYGQSVFDYDKDEVIERTLWFNSLSKDDYWVYTYSGNREDLLQKFPDNPDKIIENTLKWEKKR